jgi:hypothetical protein
VKTRTPIWSEDGDDMLTPLLKLLRIRSFSGRENSREKSDVEVILQRSDEVIGYKLGPLVRRIRQYGFDEKDSRTPLRFQ